MAIISNLEARLMTEESARWKSIQWFHENSPDKGSIAVHQRADPADILMEPWKPGFLDAKHKIGILEQMKTFLQKVQ